MTRLAVYLVLIALCVAVYRTIVPPALRSLFLAVASTLFVASFSIGGAAYVVLTVVLVFAASVVIERGGPRKRTALRFGLAWLIGSLCLLKYGPSLIGTAATSFAVVDLDLDSPVGLAPLGLSYAAFRMIHFLVEVFRGRIRGASFLDLAAYVLFFPTYLAGPVERFPRFREQSSTARFDPDDVRAGLARILMGAFRKLVIADTLAPHVRAILATPEAHPAWTVLLAIYGLAVWLYMDFGGYTDLAIGTARLFGFRIVENFDHPFFRTSIAAFWRSWHVSLYTFIRDYFFLPFFGTRPSRWKTAVGVVATMVVFMLWHGASASWLILGLYHGFALVLWSWFQELKARSPRLRRAVATTPSGIFCGLVTFHFVAFGFLWFFFDAGHVERVLTRLAGG